MVGSPFGVSQQTERATELLPPTPKHLDIRSPFRILRFRSSKDLFFCVEKRQRNRLLTRTPSVSLLLGSGRRGNQFLLVVPFLKTGRPV